MNLISAANGRRMRWELVETNGCFGSDTYTLNRHHLTYFSRAAIGSIMVSSALFLAFIDENLFWGRLATKADEASGVGLATTSPPASAAALLASLRNCREVLRLCILSCRLTASYCRDDSH